MHCSLRCPALITYAWSLSAAMNEHLCLSVEEESLSALIPPCCEPTGMQMVTLHLEMSITGSGYNSAPAALLRTDNCFS
jgi:hypothetical protein